MRACSMASSQMQINAQCLIFSDMWRKINVRLYKGLLFLQFRCTFSALARHLIWSVTSLLSHRFFLSGTVVRDSAILVAFLLEFDPAELPFTILLEEIRQWDNEFLIVRGMDVARQFGCCCDEKRLQEIHSQEDTRSSLFSAQSLLPLEVSPLMTLFGDRLQSCISEVSQIVSYIFSARPTCSLGSLEAKFILGPLVFSCLARWGSCLAVPSHHMPSWLAPNVKHFTKSSGTRSTVLLTNLVSRIWSFRTRVESDSISWVEFFAEVKCFGHLMSTPAIWHSSLSRGTHELRSAVCCCLTGSWRLLTHVWLEYQKKFPSNSQFPLYLLSHWWSPLGAGDLIDTCPWTTTTRILKRSYTYVCWSLEDL